jgi:hypothetical protein
MLFSLWGRNQKQKGKNEKIIFNRFDIYRFATAKCNDY